MKSTSSLLLCSAALMMSSCGYHVSGKGDMLPKTLRTIAIPAFGNASTRYKLTDLLASGITREFISRTKYQIITDTNAADAVLRGTVTNFISYPTVFDPATGRASTVQLSVFLRVTLTERATGKVLFERASMEVKERYEISIDPKAYFDESDPALQRLSRDVSRSVVSAVLENF
jgi:outer membrane lipopolysaccharide assembly protein LptE/RlpB